MVLRIIFLHLLLLSGTITSENDNDTFHENDTIHEYYTIHEKDTIPEKYIIHKCCPEGMRLDFAANSINCTKLGDKDFKYHHNVSLHSYYWLPLNFLVNSTTLKIHQNVTEKYIELLNEHYQIIAGSLPENCDKKEKPKQFHFGLGGNDSEKYEDFHLILFDNYSLGIYTSNPNALNNGKKEMFKFEISNNLEEDVPTAFDADSLHTIPLVNACIDSGEDGYYHLINCPCQVTTCIRKCCEDGQFYNTTSGACEWLQSDLNITDWRPDLEGTNKHYYLLLDKYPSDDICSDPRPIKKPGDTQLCNQNIDESYYDFSIYPNGSVKIKRFKRPYPPESYCGEVTWHDGGIVRQQNLLVCLRPPPPKEEGLKFRNILYGTLLLLGGTCLFITVLVSIFLPELNKRIHNKIALCHNFSLMIAYFTAGVVQLSILGDLSCIVFSLMMQFSFLASFFWLNVMCIDISMTFSTTRSIGNSNNRFSKKFMYYSIYSWGTSFIISIITITMEFSPGVPHNILKPGLKCYCGFDTDTFAVLYYFYGPMAFTLGLNLILFVFTMIKIISIQRQTAILHKTESNATGGASYQSDKQRLILYVKLFLLMGLPWVTEIASWAIGGPDEYWYFSDVVNLLRAVFIFVLFTCKKPVMRSLRRKWDGDSITSSNRTESSSISMKASGRYSNPRFSTNSRPIKRKNLIMTSLDSKRQQLVSELSASNLNRRRETQS